MAGAGESAAQPSRGPAPLLIVLGSARAEGETGRAVARLRALIPIATDLADLSAIEIRPFEYGGGSGGDGFDALVGRMLAARSILFATPVYWYAMSGRMKTLFDRFTDLLSDRDAGGRRGRGLAGRGMWMLAVGADPELPPGFEAPFRLTAAYLGLAWRGGFYVPAQAGETQREAVLADLASRIAAGTGG